MIHVNTKSTKPPESKGSKWTTVCIFSGSGHVVFHILEKNYIKKSCIFSRRNNAIQHVGKSDIVTPTSEVRKSSMLVL
jgi:hypothetical protein